MKFFAGNGKRPVRLCEETRKFAFDSLNHKYGRETWSTPAVSMDDYNGFENFEKILPYTDLFLYDIKLFDSEKHKKYTGVSNKLILENLKKLFSVGTRIWIRIPIIPSVNDNVEEMKKIKKFLDACGSPEKIELLPYHPMGESKRQALGKTPHLFEIPDPEKIKSLKEIFG